MKNSKKGISLIVLIITIVVIIILAAAVILTLNKNNPIGQAKQAVKDTDIDSIKQSVQMFIMAYMAKAEGNSPFTNGATPLITVGSTDRTTPISSVTPATAAQDVLSWNDLGLNSADYSTKYAVTIVPSTMAVTVTAK